MSDHPAADAIRTMDRRGFLRLAAASALLGSAGCRASGVPRALAPPADLELRALSPRAYATFRVAAMRLVGPHGGDAIAARRIDPAAAADAWVARLPALSATLARALWLLEFGVHPVIAKWRPFTALDAEAQDVVLENLMRSRWDIKRDLFKGLKSLAMLTFYADPASRAGVGYPGPFDRDGITLAMRYPLEPASGSERALSGAD